MTDKIARVWNGSEWVVVSAPVGVPNSIAVYQQNPPESPVDGQMWVDSDNDETGNYFISSNMDLGLLVIDIENIQVQIDGISSEVDTKQKLIPYQALSPEDPVSGDLWVDSSEDTPQLKVYDGETWIGLGSDINLESYAGNINPSTTNTYDLGTSLLRWRNIYTQDLHLSNGIGDYTVVEGEENLYLTNNKTGKSYKFALIEVDSSEVPQKSET